MNYLVTKALAMSALSLLAGCGSNTAQSACSDNDSCPGGFLCVAGACLQACVDNGGCGEGAFCRDGVCQLFECAVAADCPADIFTCQTVDLTTSCQGERSVGSCVEGSCLKVADDSACAGLLHACSDNLRPHVCSDAVHQVEPICPTACASDADCLDAYHCNNGTCVTQTGQPPNLTDAPNQQLTVGVAMNPLLLSGYVIATDADPILGYQLLTGQLPNGLTLTTQTGAITGTPMLVGTTNITWSAQDNDGWTSVGDAVLFTVAAAKTPPTIGNAPDQTATVGAAFTLGLANYVTATDGDPITGYTLLAGVLPPGLLLNPTTGAISGIPTSAGNVIVTWTARDQDGLNNVGDALQFTVMVATPVQIYATTLGGPALAMVSRGATLYGRVLNLGPTNVQACVEVVGISDNACAAPPTGWTPYPTADWTYDAGSGEWRTVIPSCAFPSNTYNLAIRDAVTAVSNTTPLTLTEDCRWTALTFPAAATPTTTCSVANRCTTANTGSPWRCDCVCYPSCS